MTHRATIRTKFASAEDAAEVYGVSVQRVEELRRLLGQLKYQRTQPKTRKSRSKRPSSAPRKNGTRRSARRAA